MNKLFFTLCLLASSITFAAETKEVCHDKVDKAGKPVMDKKTGKPAQDCKTIKIHKKLDGNPVPEKK